MKAIRLHGPFDLRLDSVADPSDPGTDEVVITVTAVGVCGSDLHMYETGGIGGKFVNEPVTLGHEFAGEVTAVGQGAVTENGEPLRIGDRVAVDPAIPCGRCEPCRNGNPNLCLDHFFHGVPPDDGALVERLKVPARNCFRLPDSVSHEAGSLLETLGVSLHAIDLGRIKLGDTVAIFGAGPVGLLLLVLAKIQGAREVLVFEPVAVRRAKAIALGATAAWDVAPNADLDEVVQPLMQQTRERGVDVVFEAADAGKSVDQSFAAARFGGRVVLVGIPARDRTEFGHSLPRRKGLTVRFSRRMKHTYPRALALQEHPLMAGVLDELVSHRFKLADSKAAFDLALRCGDGILKAIITPQN